VRGGTITWLLYTYKRYPGTVVVVAGKYGDTQLADSTLPFMVERVPMSMAEWDPTEPASLWRYGCILRHVLRSCRQHSIRQLHCLKVLPEGLVAWCVRLLTGIPYVLYAHGEEIQVGLGSRKLRWLIPRLYNGAAAIIANSYNTSDLLQKIGIPVGKIHVIHPGVETALFRAREQMATVIRRRYNIGCSPMLLTVGRLQRRKGQDMVIRALPRIAEKFPSIKYVIAGTGDDLGFLKQLAVEIGVVDRIVFVGAIDDAEHAGFYAACDIFIMPNREIGPDVEGFGIVFLEASAAGKPVIAGRSGGTAEAVKEGITGLRVDGNDVDAIAAATLRLLEDPVTSRMMGERGRQWVESSFTWGSVVDRTRKVAQAIERGGH
jgi:phosphatidylinositol alpha-1,6-mannosyltransferase